MKLTRNQRGILSEAIVSLTISEAKAGRDNKVRECLLLDKILYKYFLSQMTEEDFKEEAVSVSGGNQNEL